MRYTIVVHQDNQDGGYYAYVPDLEGCFTQADSLDELKENIKESIELSIDDNHQETSLVGIWEMDVDYAAASSY